MSTLFASFADAAAAERAAGALLDKGATSSDISVIASEHYSGSLGQVAEAEAAHAEKGAKQGISTTTPADAAMGAAKGMTIGTGVGIAAALAALIVPGFGIALGTGALAIAVGGAIGTAVAGAAVGGVAGFLKDQGVAEDMVSHYSEAFASGGAILAVAVPTGDMDTALVEGILVKYGAANVANYESTHTTMDRQQMPPTQPFTDTVPVSEPINVVQVPADYVMNQAPTEIQGISSGPQVIDPLTGMAEPVVPVSSVRPTRIDPLTGQALEGMVTDPVTGGDRAVRIENGRVIYVV